MKRNKQNNKQATKQPSKQATKKTTPMKANTPTPPVAPVKATPAFKALPKGMTHDKNLLLAVFHIQNPSHNIACNNHAMDVISGLAPEGCTVIRSKGNMLIRKGPASGPHPHYLAHMDQVHDYEPFMKVHATGNLLHAVDGNNKRTGVGGDDKCGVYLALMMLHQLDHCTAVFVRDEEVGCLGSGEVPLAWFDHASFVIQADRNNHTMDIIRDTNGMVCASDAFIKGLKELPIVCAAGHTENSGTITDIGELSSRGLEVSMVNISSGYHSPHSHNEVVLLDELAIACQLAFEAASLMGTARWHHVPESQYFSSSWGAATVTPSGKWPTSGHRTSYHSGSSSSYGGWGDTDEGIGDWTPADAASYESLALDHAEHQRRENVIATLVGAYGYDREFDGLDSWDLLDLEDILEECELGAKPGFR